MHHEGAYRWVQNAIFINSLILLSPPYYLLINKEEIPPISLELEQVCNVPSLTDKEILPPWLFYIVLFRAL